MTNIALPMPVQPAITTNAEKDLVRILLVLGDRNADHKVDVTGLVQVRMPVAGWSPPMGLTGNVPLKEVLKIGSAVAALLPGVAGQFASRAFGMAAGAVGALESLVL